MALPRKLLYCLRSRNLKTIRERCREGNQLQTAELEQRVSFGHRGCSAALVVVYLVFSSWYIVDQGERAVVLRLGAIVGESGPGPAFQGSVDRLGSQDHGAEPEQRYQALEAYSRDQQPANLTVSVTFVASDPSAIYEQYGDLDGAIARLIDPRVISGVKTIFGQYDAARAIQERAGL